MIYVHRCAAPLGSIYATDYTENDYFLRTTAELTVANEIFLPVTDL